MDDHGPGFTVGAPCSSSCFSLCCSLFPTFFKTRCKDQIQNEKRFFNETIVVFLCSIVYKILLHKICKSVHLGGFFYILHPHLLKTEVVKSQHRKKKRDLLSKICFGDSAEWTNHLKCRFKCLRMRNPTCKRKTRHSKLTRKL